MIIVDELRSNLADPVGITKASPDLTESPFSTGGENYASAVFSNTCDLHGQPPVVSLFPKTELSLLIHFPKLGPIKWLNINFIDARNKK